MLTALVARGDSVNRAMQLTGEEGVTLEDYVVYQKARLLDSVLLQRGAQDAVDRWVPLARQKESFRLVRALIARDYPFDGKDEARVFFGKLTGLVSRLNQRAAETSEYTAGRAAIDELVRTLGPTAEREPGQAVPVRPPGYGRGSQFQPGDRLMTENQR